MRSSGRSLVVGVGTRRGVAVSALYSALTSCLAAGDGRAGDVTAIVTAEVKANEPAVLHLCACLSVPLTVFPAETLARQYVPHPSVAVRRATGTPSVAEAAVLASGAHLLVPKHVGTDVTIALGVLPRRPQPHHEVETR